MTEKRKQELTHLLHEAMENLEIRPRFTHPPLPFIDIEKYKWHLRASWTSYSPNSAWFVDHFKLDINEDAKLKLLELIREEIEPFIFEDRILLGTFSILGGLSDGVHLDELLDKLLNIAIFEGIGGAVSAFDRCTTKEASISFEFIALLEGITLETEIQVFEGVRLVPLPSTHVVSQLPRCLGNIPLASTSRFFKKTMLVIDYSISPVFQNPILAAEAEDKLIRHAKGFRIEPKGKFIEKAQDLCQNSIKKILKDGKFPDWNNLILGEESL